MTYHEATQGSTFDPTLAFATDRIRARHQEAHGERLAALSSISSPSLRVRLGTALIALGSTLAAPVDTRRPAVTD